MMQFLIHTTEVTRRRMTGAFIVALAALVALLLTGCGGEADVASTTTASASEGPSEIVLMTHDSFAVSEDVLAAFTEETRITVRVLNAGDAGAMVNQAILTKDNPLADVLFGVDNTFLSRALEADLFEPYEAPGLAGVPDEFKLDPEHRVTPIDYGDVCLNYDKEYFGPLGPPVPTSLADLTKPEYAGLLVVENPATSSPGLAFLLATIAEFGEEGSYTWKDFWRDLAANDVFVASGWEEAYYNVFSGGAGAGERPLVVSYASSPPAEVVYASEPMDEAPTGVVTEGAFRQIEFAGVLAGAKAPEAARQFIDFMLSREFQEDMPLNMFVFPVLEDASLPPEFIEHTQVPEDPLSVDPGAIGAGRDGWIQEWTTIVLS
jgi:thiamine transport system substrate-binding protein